MRLWQRYPYLMAEGEGGAAGGGTGLLGSAGATGEGGDIAGGAAGAILDVAPPPADPGGAVPWTHQLANADLHGNAALTRYQTLDAFVDGHIELDKSQGGKVSYPGDEATPEDWQAFYKAVPGFPETAEQYAVGAPEMPAEAQMSEGELSTALGRFHSLGLTNSQAEGVLTLLSETNHARAQANQDASQTHIDTAYDALRALDGWGPHTERNLQVATEGIRRQFGPEQAWLETLVKTGENGAVQPLRNIPQFIQMAYEYAQMKGHARFVPGGSNAASIESAKAAINQAHTDRRAGKINDEQLNATIQQHGPLAYSQDTEGVSYQRGGASTGAPTG